jgi:hypothetical protein
VQRSFPTKDLDVIVTSFRPRARARVVDFHVEVWPLAYVSPVDGYVSPVDEIVEDFDAAVSRIEHAQSVRLQRQAVREALGHLYTLREHRRRQVNKKHKGQLNKKRKGGPEPYFELVENSPDCSEAKVTEGLVEVRGALIHDVTKPVEQALEDRYPDTYSDKYEVVLVWRQASEMKDPPERLTKPSSHYACVADQDVLGTLRQARHFLVDPGVLGPLS